MALLGSETWCDIVTNLIIIITIIIICSPNEDLILFLFLLLLILIIIVLRSMSLLGSWDDDRQGVDCSGTIGIWWKERQEMMTKWLKIEFKMR